VPLTLALVLMVAVVEKLPFMAGLGDISQAGVHLFANLVLGLVTLEILRRFARRQRMAQEEKLASRAAVNSGSESGDLSPEAVAAH